MTATTAQTTKVNDYLTGLARTVVPIIAGLIVTLALRWGHVDLHGYAVEITSVVSAGYYALVHWLERFVDPRAGFLLGVAQVAHYGEPHGLNLGTLAVTIDKSTMLDSIAASLHSAGDAGTKAKPKPRAK